MKYIKKVILENFQSHKYSEVEFDSQLNIIVGASDSGKTAIFRGIKWVLYNEPLGDFFIRQGSTFCKVIIILNDGVKVERYRSKSKNSYHLHLPNEDEMIFEGFGHGVPYEISSAIGIQRINLDKDKTRSVNLAEQLDGAFLLSESGSVKASSIGRLVGVNIIDDALRESLSDSRKLIMQKNSIDLLVGDLEKEITSYNYLEKLDEDLKKLKEIRNTINKSQIKRKNILYLKKQYIKILESKDENMHIIEKTSEIQNLQNKIEIIQELIYRKNNFNSRKKYYLEVVENIKENKFISETLVNVDLSLNSIGKLDSNLNKIYKLRKLNERWLLNEKNLKLQQSKLNRLKNIYLSEIKYKQIEKDYLKYAKYIEFRDKKTDINKRLTVGNDYIYKFKEINKINEIYRMIFESLNLRRKLLLLKNNYLEIKKDEENINKDAKTNRSNIDRLLIEYEMILSTQEKCPLCFSNIDQNKINDIIEVYKEDLKYEL